MLKLQERNKPNTGIWLVKSNTTVGQHKTCDFILSSNKVADIHIELLSNNEQITLNDRSKGKSIFVNNIPVGHYGPLKHGDIIRLGDKELEIVDPKEQLKGSEPDIPTLTNARCKQNNWQLVAVGDWLAGQRFTIGEYTSVGREATCDITIPGTHLSRRHAEFTINKDKLHIRDLDSANGTYVNEKKISTADLKPGDQIRFDVLTFEIAGPEPVQDANKTIIRSALTDADLNQATDKSKGSTTNGEKQWKTKPTSPGNRPEEELKLQLKRKQKERNDRWILILLIILLGLVSILFFKSY